MKLVFVNRFYHPDHSATSQMLTDLAGALARAGREVHVVASRQRIDDPRARLPAEEHVRGVAVHRVWASRFGRDRLPGRVADYASFQLAAGRRLDALLARGDVVVAKTDPPMLSVVAARAARRRGARLVNWLHDLFPEIATALGVPGFGGALAEPLRRLRNRSLAAAALNVAIGERMAARLRAQGVPAGRIRVIPNWADAEAIRPRARAQVGLRARWGLGDRFVVGYSGNLGRVHELATVLDAAARLAGDAGVVFVLVGGGKQRPALEREVARRGLANVRFRPYQPRERLCESLAVADAHLVTLRPQLEGLVLPSKFYGVAAAGRPTLWVGAADGEIAGIVERARCGYAIAAGDGDTLARRVRALARDPALASDMGRRARALLEQRYALDHAVAAWSAALDEAAAGAAAGAGPPG